MPKWTMRLAVLVAAVALFVPSNLLAEEGDPEILAMMHDINAVLAEQGLGYAVEEIELFTIGGGRPSNRIHQSTSRWVPGDPRRLAQADDITYMIDESMGDTASGVSSADTTAAVRRALTTWDNEACLSKVDLVERADDGGDITFFDGFFGGTFGNPFAADMVNAGWWPRSFILAVTGSDNVLAFSVSFIFTNPDGSPSDINGDNYLDRALNEVYYNDNFGDPNGTRPGNPWGIDIELPGIDIETVALHEFGHSLVLGHFGPPPSAVMNPIYAGPNTEPDPIDQAGMCAVWSSWPNP